MLLILSLLHLGKNHGQKLLCQYERVTNLLIDAMSEKKARNFFPFNVIDRLKEEKRAKENSKKIDLELKREYQRKRSNRNVKTIVTGNRGSGKSSLIEQFKLQKIFTAELDEAKVAMMRIRSCCIKLILNTYSCYCSYTEELSDFAHSDSSKFNEYQELMRNVLNEINGMDLTPISDESKDEKTEWERYLLENFGRILNPEYTINLEDLVVWKKSCFNNNFEKDLVKLQHTENPRLFCNLDITHFRKPISGKLLTSHFENTEVVLFCFSLQNFCQLEESIKYFKLLVELPSFSHSDFILLLTKRDILKEMFEEIQLPNELLDFFNSHQIESHGQDEFCEYIYSRFNKTLQETADCKLCKSLYHYNVNCVDYEDMNKISNAISKLIVELSISCKCCCRPSLI